MGMSDVPNELKVITPVMPSTIHCTAKISMVPAILPASLIYMKSRYHYILLIVRPSPPPLLPQSANRHGLPCSIKPTFQNKSWLAFVPIDKGRQEIFSPGREGGRLSLFKFHLFENKKNKIVRIIGQGLQLMLHCAILYCALL